jgi:hypothetical protein
LFSFFHFCSQRSLCRVLPTAMQTDESGSTVHGAVIAMTSAEPPPSPVRVPQPHSRTATAAQPHSHSHTSAAQPPLPLRIHSNYLLPATLRQPLRRRTNRLLRATATEPPPHGALALHNGHVKAPPPRLRDLFPRHLIAVGHKLYTSKKVSTQVIHIEKSKYTVYMWMRFEGSQVRRLGNRRAQL